MHVLIYCNSFFLFYCPWNSVIITQTSSSIIVYAVFTFILQILMSVIEPVYVLKSAIITMVGIVALAIKDLS